jgi:hypothetical protein
MLREDHRDPYCWEHSNILTGIQSLPTLGPKSDPMGVLREDFGLHAICLFCLLSMCSVVKIEFIIAENTGEFHPTFG